MQQGQQDSDGLLLEPADDECQWEIVDAAVEGIGQGNGDRDSAVGIVALAHVHEPRQAEMLAVVVIADAVFAAAEGEDEGVCRRRQGIVGKVIATLLGAVAAADDEEAADLAGLDGVDDRGRLLQQDGAALPKLSRWPWSSTCITRRFISPHLRQ